MKKYLFFFSKLLFSFLIVFYLFSKIEFLNYWHLLRTANQGYFLLALFFYFLNLVVFTYKWRVLTKMMGLNIGFSSLLRNNLISLFYSLFLPGGFLSGETIKCYKISKGKNSKIRLVFSVFLDRLTGVFAFIFIGFVFLLISGSLARDVIIIYLILLSLVIFIYMFLVIEGLRKKIKNLIVKLIKKIKPEAGIISSLDKEKFVAAAHVNKAIIWGFVFQLTLSLGLYFVILSLGYKVSLVNLIWINSLVSVATMIPVSFMGIGLRDFSLVYFLSKFGLPAEASIGAATLIVVLIIIRGLPGGIIDFKENFHKI